MSAGVSWAERQERLRRDMFLSLQEEATDEEALPQYHVGQSVDREAILQQPSHHPREFGQG